MALTTRRTPSNPDAMQWIDAGEVVASLDDTEEMVLPEGANGTQEIDIWDVLEEIPIPRTVGHVAAMGQPDGLDASKTAEIARARFRPRRFQGLVAAVMGGALLLLAAAAAVRLLGGSEDASPPRAPLATVHASTAASIPRGSPNVDVSVPGSGSILAPNARSVAIDGKRLRVTSAVVPCGAHSVRVDGRPPRTIYVPCGRTVTLDRVGNARK
jgi:hypothetical protein